MPFPPPSSPDTPGGKNERHINKTNFVVKNVST
uniref:Uncharacterized protein n=1 Tax=Human betaherpesvirus 6 TaxID=10368 RepID=A0A5P9U7Q2_9BETA|nr:hypothetical protein [Human betaherpesvirus 6]QFW55201.1 hypothetical protein [Human betaherpesvirus 6]